MFNCVILMLKTGANISECYEALAICADNVELASEYLQVKSENIRNGIKMQAEEILEIAIQKQY